MALARDPIPPTCQEGNSCPWHSACTPHLLLPLTFSVSPVRTELPLLSVLCFLVKALHTMASNKALPEEPDSRRSILNREPCTSRNRTSSIRNADTDLEPKNAQCAYFDDGSPSIWPPHRELCKKANHHIRTLMLLTHSIAIVSMLALQLSASYTCPKRCGPRA